MGGRPRAYGATPAVWARKAWKLCLLDNPLEYPVKSDVARMSRQKRLFLSLSLSLSLSLALFHLLLSLCVCVVQCEQFGLGILINGSLALVLLLPA